VLGGDYVLHDDQVIANIAMRVSVAQGDWNTGYTREDDSLGQALLGEGQALRELFRRPLIHGALPHPNAPADSEHVYSTIAMLLSGVCSER
jgi:hypothetical protein